MVSRKQVLLVGQEFNEQGLVRSLVEEGGYECLMVEDGIEALGLLEVGCVDKAKHVKLLITKLRLSDMSGVELLHEMSRRGHLGSAQVIVLAQHLRTIMRKLIVEAGAHSVFTQPYSLDLLKEVLTGVMEGQKTCSYRKALIGQDV